jgi:two-component system, NarL family, nitrate/nitrite response regulator NarL
MRRQGHVIVLAGANTLVREGLKHILRPPKFRIAAITTNVRDLDFESLRSHESILLIHELGAEQGAAIPQIALFKEQCPAARVVVLGEHDRLVDMVRAFEAGANAYFSEIVTYAAFIKALELVMLGETILPPRLLSCIDHTRLGHEYPQPGRDPELHVGSADPCDGLGAARMASEELSHDPAERGDQPSSASCASDVLTGKLAPVNDRAFPRLSSREHDILCYISEGASNKVIARRFDITEGTVKIHVKTILRKIGASNRTQAAIWAMNHSSLIWPQRSFGSSLLRQTIDPADHGTEPGVRSLTQVSQTVGKG